MRLWILGAQDWLCQPETQRRRSWTALEDLSGTKEKLKHSSRQRRYNIILNRLYIYFYAINPIIVIYLDLHLSLKYSSVQFRLYMYSATEFTDIYIYYKIILRIKTIIPDSGDIIVD